jgi:hypothetical protein
MAADYGIHGFLFLPLLVYWKTFCSNDRRMRCAEKEESPISRFMLLVGPNENWTRRWDGLEKKKY